MAETYTAWNGDDYPWPPPEGWELKSDGRYWPADQGSPAPADDAPDSIAGAATVIGGIDPTPSPAPAPTPSPAPSPTTAPGGFTPPPGPPPGPAPAAQGFGGPPPGAPATPQTGPVGGPPPAEKKGMSTAAIVLLSLLALIVLGIGGCIVAVGTFANEVGEEFEEAVEERQAAQEAARAEITLSECRVDAGGVPAATGTVANRSGGRSDYSVEVVFMDDTGRRLTSGFVDVDNVEDGADITFDAVSTDTGITTQITCGLGDIDRRASN